MCLLILGKFVYLITILQRCEESLGDQSFVVLLALRHCPRRPRALCEPLSSRLTVQTGSPLTWSSPESAGPQEHKKQDRDIEQSTRGQKVPDLCDLRACSVWSGVSVHLLCLSIRSPCPHALGVHFLSTCHTSGALLRAGGLTSFSLLVVLTRS